MPPSGRYGSRDRLRLDATSLPVAPRGASRSLWCAVRFSAGTVANAAAWAVLAVLIAVAFVTVNLLGPAGLVILGLFVLFVCAAVPIRGIGRAERRRSRRRQQGKGWRRRPPASNAREYPSTRAPAVSCGMAQPCVRWPGHRDWCRGVPGPDRIQSREPGFAGAASKIPVVPTGDGLPRRGCFCERK